MGSWFPLNSPNRSVLLSLRRAGGLRWTSTLYKEALMDGRSFPEIPCAVCSKPVNLKLDLSADENGKAVHTECYVKRITAAPGNPWATSGTD